MVTLTTKPTREQIARVVDNDQRMIAAFEAVFNATIVELPDEVLQLAGRADLSAMGLASTRALNVDGVSGLNTALAGKLGVSDEAATVATISGLVIAGRNVSVTGSGTTADPYVVTASTSGASGSFTAGSGETITVTNGLITGIV